VILTVDQEQQQWLQQRKDTRFIGFDLSQTYVDAAKVRVEIKNADKRVENSQHGEKEDGDG